MTTDRKERKFSRVRMLIGQWERIGKKIRGDIIRGLSDPEWQDAAICALLIYTTGMRPGREGNATDGQPTYGATTLMYLNIAQSGNAIRLQFVGKKAVEQDVLVDDFWLAKWLRAKSINRLPQYLTLHDRLFDVRQSVLEKYFHSLGGWTPKEFRTSVGTQLFTKLASEADLPDGKLDRKRAINGILDQVAMKLGNTKAVCRSAYVDPEILEEYR